MPGTFAGAIANDTGWGGTEIFLGLTFAMLMMAAISPFIARLLARFGGQRVVFIGSLTIAASCLAMSQADSLIFWYVAWLLAGVGMRLALYDALFAALVNLYGQRAKVTISRVTGWRTGLSDILAAGHRAARANGLAWSAGNLQPVWPA